MKQVLLCLITLLLLACRGQSASASQLIHQLDAHQNQTIVTYGTSLTAGGAWVSQIGNWLAGLYPGQVTMINSGIGGASSVVGLANLNSSVLAHNPDTVFLEFAVNDAYTPYGLSVQNSKDNLNTMIDTILSDDPQREIILMTMNSAWDVPSGNQSAALRPNLAAYYQGYRDVAAQRGLLLIDHYPAWLQLQQTNSALFQQYVPDGIHPIAAGLAALTTPTIQSALLFDPPAASISTPEPGSGVALFGLGIYLLRKGRGRRRTICP